MIGANSKLYKYHSENGRGVQLNSSSASYSYVGGKMTVGLEMRGVANSALASTS
jgi:hypothetical protein